MSVAYGKRDGVIGHPLAGAVWRQLKNRSEGSSDDIFELEAHFLLQLPPDAAAKIKAADDGSKESDLLKGKLQIQFQANMRDATVVVDGETFHGRLKDLPAILEVQKTLDRKTLYKCGDASQMLVCRKEPWPAMETTEKAEKGGGQGQQWPHGLTPPMKNVRKRRFRKTLRKKYMDAPELDKELKRLLRKDLEASEVFYEELSEAEDQRRKAEGRGNVPGEAAVPALLLPPPTAAPPPPRPREFCLHSDAAATTKESSDVEMAEIMASAGVLPSSSSQPPPPPQSQ